MGDFIIGTLRYIPFDFELAAVLLFIGMSQKLKRIELVIGLILFVTCVLDLGSSAIVGNNLWFFNYSMPAVVLMHSIFYRWVLNSIKIKNVILICVSVFLIAHILNMLLGQGLEKINTFTILPALAFTGYLSFLYLRQRVESSDEQPFKDFLFWFSSANLLNFMATIPVLATLNWFPNENAEIAGLLYDINSIIGYYIYFSFIIFGLIWTRRFQVSSSS